VRILKYSRIRWPDKRKRPVDYPIEMLDGDLRDFDAVLKRLKVRSVTQLITLIKAGDLFLNAFDFSSSDADDLFSMCRKHVGQKTFDVAMQCEPPLIASCCGLNLDSSLLKIKHVPGFNQAKYPAPVPPFSNFKIPEKALGSVFDQGHRGTCVAAATKRLFRYTHGIDVSVQYIYGMMKKKYDPGCTGDGARLEWAVDTLQEFGWVLETDLPYVRALQPGNPAQLPLGGSQAREDELIAMGKRNALSVSSMVKMDVQGREEHFATLAGTGVNPWKIPVPVAMAMSLFKTSLNAAMVSGGYMTEPLPGEFSCGGHALLLIGWQGDTKDDGYAVLCNTWGAGSASLPMLYVPYKRYYCKYTH